MREGEYNPTFPKQISEIPNLDIIIIITITIISTYNKTMHKTTESRLTSVNGGYN